MQILIGLRRINDGRLASGIVVSCKNIIPLDLLESLRKNIIIGCLGLTGFRSGHSRGLARDLARSECFPGVSLENMT